MTQIIADELWQFNCINVHFDMSLVSLFFLNVSHLEILLIHLFVETRDVGGLKPMRLSAGWIVAQLERPSFGQRPSPSQTASHPKNEPL